MVKPPGRSWSYVGLDLGQIVDPSAIVVIERAELTGDWDAVYWARRKTAVLRLRHLERMPLKTPYTEVVERVRDVVQSRDLLGKCELVVDGTGVGPAVVDMLRNARLGCTISAVTITSGEKERSDGDWYRVPKRDLVVGLQTVLQTGGLEIANGMEESAAFLSEIAEMRVRITAKLHDQYGAWREGTHDDLVLATAMAVWGARKRWPRTLVGDAGWWTRDDVRLMF